MSYKLYRQILTFFDLSKKARLPQDVSTPEYELLNHLNTAVNSFASVCVLQSGAFFCLFGTSQNSRAFYKIFLRSWLPNCGFHDYPCEREENYHPPLRLRREVRK